MKYDWIFFDADGTLFDYDAAETAALEGAFAKCGLPCDSEIGPLYSEINAGMWRDFELGMISQLSLCIVCFELL